MTHNILLVVLLVAAVLAVVSILMQQKGTGLTGVFGGSDVSYLTRRGAEKFLTFFTIVMIVIFVVSAFGILIVK